MGLVDGFLTVVIALASFYNEEWILMEGASIC